MTDARKIVCLCGSMRYTDEMLIKQFELRKSGVLAIGWCAVPSEYLSGPHLGEADADREQQETLDAVHRSIIDICDEVFVLNIAGYIGDSTRSEIEYAQKIGKPVEYQEPR